MGASVSESVGANIGRFITMEGTEGGGKSTNLGFVRDWLTSRGIHVVGSSEPGGTPLAEEIRHLLLSNRAEPLFPLTEQLLKIAARALELDQVGRTEPTREH